MHRSWRLTHVALWLLLSLPNFALAQVTASLISPSGEVIATLDKDDAYQGPMRSGRMRVIRGDKHGYLDRQGKLIIAASFEQAEDFSEGLAWVRVGDKWGLIDDQGKPTLQPTYASARPFKNGVALVSLDGSTWLAIDRNGKPLSAPILTPERARFELESQLLPYNDGDFFGYKDLFGQVKIPAKKNKWTSAAMFFEGRALVRDKKGFGYIDRSGALVIKTGFIHAEDFALEEVSRTPYAIVYGGKPARTRIIDVAGKDRVVFDKLQGMNVAEVGRYQEGLAPFAVNNKASKFPWMLDFGFVDFAGRVAIAPQFAWAGTFLGGMAVVSNQMRNRSVFSSVIKQRTEAYNQKPAFGFVNRAGELVIPIAFETYNTEPFADEPYVNLKRPDGSRVYLGRSGKPFFGDGTRPSGRWIESDRIPQCESFEDERAKKRQRCGYLDAKGEWAIAPRFASAQEFSEGVAYVRELPNKP